MAADVRANDELKDQVSTHVHDTDYFDRTLCPDPCGAMHSYCAVCGEPQDPCAFEASDEDVLRVIATVAARWKGALDLLGNDWGRVESNIGQPEGASVAHQIPRGAERSQEIATDPDRSQLDGPSETRSD